MLCQTEWLLDGALESVWMLMLIVERTLTFPEQLAKAENVEIIKVSE